MTHSSANPYAPPPSEVVGVPDHSHRIWRQRTLIVCERGTQLRFEEFRSERAPEPATTASNRTPRRG